MAIANISNTGQADNYGIGALNASKTALDSRTSGTQVSTGGSSSTGTSSGSNSNTTTQNGTSTTSSLDPASSAALQKLIQMLMSGGTQEQRQNTANRNSEISTVRDAREGYSKGAAFNDAQGLIAQTMRRALESMLPSINKAAEDAGSSGGALRALLLQDAASKAAEASSVAGLGAAAQYGGITANLSSVLEGLTKGSPVTDALLQALNVAKGATSTTTTSGTTTQIGQTSGTQSQVGTTSNTTKSNENRDYAPFQTVSTSPLYYGSTEMVNNGSKGIGSTTDFLNELYGKQDPWAGYQI